MLPLSDGDDSGISYFTITHVVDSFFITAQHVPGLLLLAIILFCLWWKSQRKKSKHTDPVAASQQANIPAGDVAANPDEGHPRQLEHQDKAVHNKSDESAASHGLQGSKLDAQRVASFRCIIDPLSIPDPRIQDQLRHSIAKALAIPPDMVRVKKTKLVRTMKTGRGAG